MKSIVAEYLVQVLLISLLVGSAALTGYRTGRLDTDKKWQTLLAEKNIIVLNVSTNYTTNYHGDFKWAK